MRFNFRKVFFVFFVILLFSFSGDLAAQVPDNLVVTPESATLNLNGTQQFQARLTSSSAGVDGERVYFYVLDPPALGSIDPEDSLTNGGGYAYTTYTASTTCGVDTLVVTWYEKTSRQDLVDTVIITINPGLIVGFNVQLEGGETEIWIYDDTVNIEVTAIDIFGNTTDLGLPLNAHLSANRTGVVFTGGEIRLMDNSIELYPMVATVGGVGLIITVEDLSKPSVNGESYPITVYPIDAVEESPVVSDISVAFGTGDISYAVAEDGEVTIKVYNKVGMEVATLVDGVVSRGYYQALLEELGLSSDVYFVVMQGPGINKKIKATLIK